MAQNVLVFQKLRWIYGIAFLFAALLILFAFRWQVVEAQRFSDILASRNTDDPINSIRGAIYARDGSTLAYSEPRYNVFIWLPELTYRESKDLQTRADFLSALADNLDTSVESLESYILKLQRQNVKWMQVGEAITFGQRNGIEESMVGMKGHFFSLTSRRIYPEGEMAAHVLGLTSVDEYGNVQGLGGMEGAWDGNLEPIQGYISGDTDAHGNAIGTASVRTIEAKRGSSIHTSIDKTLQNIVEKKLEWAVDYYGAKSGAIVIMDPKTGEILALANNPTYDPNLREVDDPNIFGNKSISEPYEIGSVGKVLTLAAAIDSGVVTPNSVILPNGHKGCEKIHEELAKVCTHDKAPQPPIPMKEAFALSDNLYFFHLSEMMNEHDPELFYNYLDKFGIGKPTGVDIAGESYGYLKNWQAWNIADVAAYSYGHSYQINVLQGISSIGAVANYGVRMQPHLVTKVVQSDGKEIPFEPTPLEQILKRRTTLQMDEMMHVIYQRNIFWWEHQYDDLRNYKIAMKSGTALIPYRDRAGYSLEINASYVGYDASPERTFIMLTRLEEPEGGGLASYNSRVLWLETFRAIKDYLDVPRIGEF